MMTEKPVYSAQPVCPPADIPQTCIVIKQGIINLK
jgi:hypothetical protein